MIIEISVENSHNMKTHYNLYNTSLLLNLDFDYWKYEKQQGPVCVLIT